MATHTYKSRPAVSSLKDIVNPDYAIDNDSNTCATITKKGYSAVNTSIKTWANALPDNTTINTIRLYHIGSGTSHSSGTIVTTKWNGVVRFQIYTSCATITPYSQSTSSTLATKDNTYTADNIMNSFRQKASEESGNYTINGSILDWIRGNGSYTYNGSSNTSQSMTFRIEMGSTSSIHEATANLYEIFFEINYTIPDYTIKAISNNSGYGTATINNASSAIIECQSTGTLKAIPNAGCKFIKWSDGNTNATRTVTSTKDVTYTAYFEKDLGYVTYDSIFNFKKWKDSGINSDNNATVSNITDTGFSITANANDSYTANSPLYSVLPNTNYTLEYNATGTGHEMFVFCDGLVVAGRFWSTSNGILNFTVPSDCNTIAVRCDSNIAGNTVTYSNIRIYPTDQPYRSNTVSQEERVDSGDWSIPTPTREGYDFIGWFDTQAKTGGTQYTSSSSYPTSDLQLWSRWKLKNKICIGKKETSAIYVGKNKVKNVYINKTKVYEQ